MIWRCAPRCSHLAEIGDKMCCPIKFDYFIMRIHWNKIVVTYAYNQKNYL